MQYSNLYYLAHRQDHIDENGNFPCRYCDKKKPKYEEISKHIYMIHWEHRSSGCKKPKKDKGKTWKCYYCKKTFLREKILREHRKLTHTGKSLSEALLFAEHGENMLCTEIVLNVKNNFCSQHVLPMF